MLGFCSFSFALAGRASVISLQSQPDTNRPKKLDHHHEDKDRGGFIMDQYRQRASHAAEDKSAAQDGERCAAGLHVIGSPPEHGAPTCPCAAEKADLTVGDGVDECLDMEDLTAGEARKNVRTEKGVCETGDKSEGTGAFEDIRENSHCCMRQMTAMIE